MDDDERVWWCACVEGGEAETNPRSYSTQVPLAACVRSLIKLTVIFLNVMMVNSTHDKQSRPRRGDHGAQLGGVDLGPIANTTSTKAAF